MLLNDFYKILTVKELSDNEILAEILVNPEHEIFKGHFPGNPVVPGVVSIQMINEISAEQLGKKLMTSKARNIKFPAMINPNTHPKLFVKINFTEGKDSSFKVNAQIFFEDIVFLKFNGSFSVV
ncbi:MAG: 3-hydroxyacyl-ACP dehydratase [Chlorobi bacterium]|nr:3-hydroxyacyl-ACP dehydratase [Chlorobiota bacterium]